jgi:hypothetical protein
MYDPQKQNYVNIEYKYYGINERLSILRHFSILFQGN